MASKSTNIEDQACQLKLCNITRVHLTEPSMQCKRLAQKIVSVADDSLWLIKHIKPTNMNVCSHLAAHDRPNNDYWTRTLHVLRLLPECTSAVRS